MLVWGFWVQGINNDRHFLWRILVGPYWHLEVWTITAIGLGFIAFGLWKLLVLIRPFVEWIESVRDDLRQAELKRVCDLEEKSDRLKRERLIQEKQARFDALPPEERERIHRERKDASRRNS